MTTAPDPRTALAVAAVVALIGALGLWPRWGVVSRWRRRRPGSERTRREDVLKHLHVCESAGREPSVESIAGAAQLGLDRAADLLQRMQADGMLRMEGTRPRLTDHGRIAALRVVRAHRLWERYLADETGLAEAEWHDQAERQEHALSPMEMDALSAQLGHPTHDPHGDPIPTETGELPAGHGVALTSLRPDVSVRVVHLEDEPPNLYAQIVASGLHPGMEARLLENSAERVRLWSEHAERVLTPVAAANVTVQLLPRDVQVVAGPDARLSELEPGEWCEVVGLAAGSRGMERRRLMDLGILPGTRIRAEMRSPSADPTAYRIRGALIALRRDQARHVRIRGRGVAS